MLRWSRRARDLPSDKYVTRLLAGEDVVVLQDDLVRVPDDHPQFKPGQQNQHLQDILRMRTQINNNRVNEIKKMT